jgi:hypothetical protein
MVLGRLLLSLLATLVLVTTANASSTASAAAPVNLRGFLFRADEPLRREFARTPSFAWSPVAGASRYEFELATSNTFRDNGLIVAERELKTPVAAVNLTLPWITGAPYSLYARVRGVVRGVPTAWSKPFGFNLRQPDVPKPLPTHAGLLRWTPIEGASGYDVWLIDANKHTIVTGNVFDQREFYTFHQSDPWISNLRWRIRAMRSDIEVDGQTRGNGMPAVTYGPWSPVYESKNPSFEQGPLRLVGTISDVASNGSASAPAHRLMPAFVFAGNLTADGTAAELFRVYVFTDRDCINTVFTGSIVGSPSFAARPYGGLAMPRSFGAIAAARSAYLPHGDEGTAYTYDDRTVTPVESLPQATPTTSLPGGSAPAAPTTPSEPGTTPAPAPGATGAVTFLTVAGNFGAPVDLWDTNWPEGGYYWTVVPVEAVSTAPLTTSLSTAASLGDTTIELATTGSLAAGDLIELGSGPTRESATVSTVSGNLVTLAAGLRFNHNVLEAVSRAGGSLIYRDLELPQEVCAAGRVMRFGKSSEPTLVSAGSPFASGLSPKGRLTTASGSSTSFYSSPLVAWTPTLGADAYHVQWSKKRAPFTPVAVNWKDKGASTGFLTLGTSAVLTLPPGTWWYRVRGVSFNLPSSAQYMGWSDPARIVVSKPTFSVAKSKPKPKG